MKKLFILLTLLINMVGGKAMAYDLSAKNSDGITIYYNFINNETELVVAQSSDYSGIVNIPEEVVYMDRTLKVTSVGEKAFYRCYYLTAVTISNNVTTIDASAFQECTSMSSITIGNNVMSVGESAFCDCSSLSSVTIPNSVTTIGSYAFQGCTGITSLTLGDNVSTIGYCAFKHCTSLTSVTFPNNVTFLGGESFWGCKNLTSVIMGSSITKVGQSTFRYCTSLTSITIPNSVTEIGDYAFFDCSLTFVAIPNSVTWIGAYAFGSTKLTSVTIPSSVTFIGYAAFGCPLSIVISENENPFDISESIFGIETFEEGTLYVPVGMIDKYKAREGWKLFKSIEEGVPKFILKYIIYIGNNCESYKQYKVEYGASITPESEPIKEGYTFSGWSEIPETMPDHDVEVTGTFTINSYTITYKIDGEVFKTESVEYGSAITPPEAPTREGYTFEWMNMPETMPAHDITIDGSYTSGIDSVYKEEGGDVKWYTIDGKQKETPQKGINIMKTSNGKTRKMLMK